MSQHLARRAGTVGALVAAASVTMVAGVWPAPGIASASETPPAHAGSSAPTEAPGPAKKEPAPVVDVVVPGPVVEDSGTAAPVQADAPGQLKEAGGPVAEAPGRTRRDLTPAAQAPGQVKKEATVVDTAPDAGAGTTPAATGSAATGSAATGSATAPARRADAPGAADAVAPVQGPVVGPATGVVGPPAAADKALPQEHAPVHTSPPVTVATAQATQDSRPQLAVGGREEVLAAGPRVEAPAVEARVPARQPLRVGPVVPVSAAAPVVPVAAPRRDARPAARPEREVSAFVPSPNALLAAADAMPLRPTGAASLSLPVADRQPQPQQVRGDLASALPSLAAGTAEAVAERPALPLGIAAVVVLFLLVQNRIDRRDPKLALAPVEDDEPLEFAPPRAVVHLQLVQAA